MQLQKVRLRVITGKAVRLINFYLTCLNICFVGWATRSSASRGIEGTLLRRVISKNFAREKKFEDDKKISRLPSAKSREIQKKVSIDIKVSGPFILFTSFFVLLYKDFEYDIESRI